MGLRMAEGVESWPSVTGSIEAPRMFRGINSQASTDRYLMNINDMMRDTTVYTSKATSNKWCINTIIMSSINAKVHKGRWAVT